MRLVHPRDISAIQEWINVHADPAQARQMIESLPSLPVGTAWFWSPGWGDIFQRVKIRARETFDSSATPKVGQKSHEPKVLAPVEIEQLGVEITTAVQRARENDPAHLKPELAQLRNELAKAQGQKTSAPPKLQVKEVPVLREAQISRLEKVVQQMNRTAQELIGVGKSLGEGAGAIHKGLLSAAPVKSAARIAPDAPSRALTPAPPAARTSDQNQHGDRLPEGERLTLTAIAQYPQGASRDQLSVLTGYKRSTRNTYIHRLSQRGYITSAGDRLAATDGGIEALGEDFTPLPTGDGLRRYWLERLPEGERKVLEVLIARYPQAMPRDDLDALTGYTRSSRNTYLHRLNARRLIQTQPHGQVRASDDLFEAAPQPD
jgi:CRP-like cAMP-binding protein